MPKNRSNARKNWRKNRATERDMFGAIQAHMVSKAVEKAGDVRNYESPRKYAIEVGANYRELATDNPMWREIEDRKWAMKKRPNN